jgi:PTH2 family peptidyl-tRNA hydrolase
MDGERPVKQVIVIRKDLNMRKGKMCAQAAHASMKQLMDFMVCERQPAQKHMEWVNVTTWNLGLEDTHPMALWLNGIFVKICVYVKSEAELDAIFVAAEEAGIPCAMIEDNGLTEFKGIKTKTCCAVGPWWSDEIDKITGELPLL